MQTWLNKLSKSKGPHDEVDNSIHYFTEEEIKKENEEILKRLWTIHYPDGKKVIVDKETKLKYSIEIE